MPELYGVYAVAAGLIGIMLILCIDIVRKNKEILELFTKKESKPPIAAVNQDKVPVYPLYIDCSSDLIKNQNSFEIPDDHPMTVKQGA
ncbi:hypothetical protein [Paenibacillus sp. UNC451MF]|uniref:hypothetical protein n=1 Tax=Paenibacillus sp. UNC451MF TaxID=1449063 RepID=UPI00048FDC1E|nr:hypothetical protein [Paenibacillus sp. UNC451MF]